LLQDLRNVRSIIIEIVVQGEIATTTLLLLEEIIIVIVIIQSAQGLN